MLPKTGVDFKMCPREPEELAGIHSTPRCKTHKNIKKKYRDSKRYRQQEIHWFGLFGKCGKTFGFREFGSS
jgi:hypothetical protein